MLAKKYRLPIQFLPKKEGRVIRTPFFSIKIFPNPESPYPRYGVIISKKVFSRASARNNLKRTIFSKLEPRKSKDAGDFLIIANPAVGKLEQEEILRKLEEVLNKLPSGK